MEFKSNSVIIPYLAEFALLRVYFYLIPKMETDHIFEMYYTFNLKSTKRLLNQSKPCSILVQF